MKTWIGLALCAGLGAQAHSLRPLNSVATRSATTQDEPTREQVSYVVMFDRRSFDLEDLRIAIAQRSKDRVASLIRHYERLAAEDQQSFASEAAALGGTVRQHFWLINGCAIDAPPRLTAAMLAIPGVVSVHEDELRPPQSLSSVLPINIATDANNHNADALQAMGIIGSASTVAVIDSMFDIDVGGAGRPHATFFTGGNPFNQSGGGIGGSRFVLARQIGSGPFDGSGSHGTRVAAVVAGARWNRTAGAGDGHAPGARIAGYSIAANLPFAGVEFAEIQTMVAAFQQTVADRVANSISVAVMAYAGSPSALSPEQQAMDAAARIGDLFVTVAGTVSIGITDFRHGASNVLAAGSAVSNTHEPTLSSSVGPLPDGATYPHILGNGVNIVTPEIDNELANLMSSGTSFGTAQVAGAATLFRSITTTATGLETRAAILATTEGYTPDDPSNQRGYGYLRDDRMADLGLGRGANLLTSGRFDARTTLRSFNFTPSAAGEVYTAVLSFDRQITTLEEIANLDLRVLQNGVELASSRSTTGANEKLAFRAQSTSPVLVLVERISLQPGTSGQDFALAIAAAPDARIPGQVTRIGTGCSSSPGALSTLSTGPRSVENRFLTNSDNSTLGGGVHRIQMIYDRTQAASAAANVTALAFRHDDSVPPSAGRQWIDVEIDAGPSTVRTSGMQANFAANRNPHIVNVVQRRRIALTRPVSTNASPSNWRVVIPLDQAFSTFPDLAGPLFVEIRVLATSAGVAPITYPIDAIQGSNEVASLIAMSPTATSGTLMMGSAPAIAFVEDFDAGRIPQLDVSGQPEIGSGYTLELTDAPASAPAILFFGRSDITWSGLPLPVDLGLLGASGCSIVTSLEVPSSVTANAGGAATLNLALPLNPALVGARVFHQAVAVDLEANAFGIILSNGIGVEIGR